MSADDERHGDGWAQFAPLPESGWLAVSTSVWRRAPHDPVTDAAPDVFVAGCRRLDRLPLRAARTP